jgi:hypothetical protein
MSVNTDYKTKLDELIAERTYYKKVGNYIKEHEIANKINQLKIDTNYGKLPIPMPIGTGGKSNKKSKKQRGKRSNKTRRNKRWFFF